ncbi:hypothetical protein DFH27DRAFT_480805, partial [Peziza echinospora]
ELLKILSPLEPIKRHQEICRSRLNNSGTWFTEGEQFLSWIQSGSDIDPINRMLCCYGDPGAGKTVMSSIVIEKIFQLSAAHGRIGVAVMYCDYQDREAQTNLHIIGSFLHQLLLTLPYGTPREVYDEIQSIRQRGRHVERSDLTKMLMATLKEFHTVYVCIDALDELHPMTLTDLLVGMGNNFPTARVFLTGRPTVRDVIRRTLKLSKDEINTTIRADPDDIQHFLLAKIAEDYIWNPYSMNDELKAEILNTLINHSKEM